MRIFGPVIQGLQTALEVYQAQHRVIAENIANSETPGYRARQLEFANVLEQAFTDDETGRLNSETAEPTVDPRPAIKLDGNSVDLDTEMAHLSENNLKIVALSQILARKYQGLKMVIEEGGSR